MKQRPNYQRRHPAPRRLPHPIPVSLAALPLAAMLLAVAPLLPACGGGNPGRTGPRPRLLAFSHDGADNVTLNATLVFEFSDAIAAASVSSASVQIRQGPQFGLIVPGHLQVDGSTIRFEPRLPTACDLSDAGLQPDTHYRVLVVGAPAAYAVRDTTGRALAATAAYEFHTRRSDDPARFADGAPGRGPRILAHHPADGSQAVAVTAGNGIEVTFSESLDPCTVNEQTVRVTMTERGERAFADSVVAPNGNRSGFYSGTDPSDQAPGDVGTWGAASGHPVSPAQRIPVHLALRQSATDTRLWIAPRSGWHPEWRQRGAAFPENALLVVELTAEITDLVGQPLAATRFAFTTENLRKRQGAYPLDASGTTPFVRAGRTADVDSPRAPGLVQGFLVFAGTGDNGTDLTQPSGPGDPTRDCVPGYQEKDGTLDHFDATRDVLLDTGATRNACANDTDGSTAVTFEYASFRIRSGVTVALVGVNPAILKVLGDVVIESGGTLLARGDGRDGRPRGRGHDGASAHGVPRGAAGGIAVAGGGDGGASRDADNAVRYGEAGVAGFGSPEHGTRAGLGAGRGNVNAVLQVHNTAPTRNAGAGGGGGHATAGGPGAALGTGTNVVFAGAPDGAGGEAYGTEAAGRLLRTPFAGSGGGASGAAYSSYTDERASGGAGGAGGGFVDVTAGGDVWILGTVDAAGSPGGDGVRSPWGQEHQSSGGGGGGGGGIRILTPADIRLTGGTLTAAGGAGGRGAVGTVYPGPRNDGGAGGSGRIVLEDGDSLITGLTEASVTPGEGEVGFHRGTLDATRFHGGGLRPSAVTEPFPLGVFDPRLLPPVAEDFDVGIPRGASRGIGATGILVEARGFATRPDGAAAFVSDAPWIAIGHFEDSGVPTAPRWVPGVNADGVPGSSPSAGVTRLAPLQGHEYLQVRFTFFLPDTLGPVDPGPYVSCWRIRFTTDG